VSASDAKRCDGCERVTYNVESVALLAGGKLRAERRLCPACRTNAIDLFRVVSDRLPLMPK
jgi:hypothetical protein